MLSTFIKAAPSEERLSITNLSNLQAATSASVYTFSSADLGTPSLSRHIIVVGTAVIGSGSGSVTSVTVGGETGSITVQEVRTTATAFASITKVPSGGTGDIVVTFNNTFANLAISVFEVQGAQTVSSAGSFSSGNLSGSSSITTVDGGVLVGARLAGGAASSVTLSWSNSITAINSTLVTTVFQRYVTAYSENSSTSETVSWSSVGSPFTRALAVASYQPA
jgi:hypothetical protein